MTAPERIASGVCRVDAVRFSNAISVLLVEDSEGWTLVDTGVRSSVVLIQEALVALGGRPKELRRIYLTHHHSDNTGGLPGVRVWAPEAEVVSSEQEAEVISGRRGPDPPSNPLLRFVSRYQKLPVMPVNRLVSE